jgi:hypothetical protein
MMDSLKSRHPITAATLSVVSGAFALGLVWKAVPELRRYLRMRHM